MGDVIRNKSVGGDVEGQHVTETKLAVILEDDGMK